LRISAHLYNTPGRLPILGAGFVGGLKGRLAVKARARAVRRAAYPVEVEINAGYGDTLIVIVVNVTPKDCFNYFGLVLLGFVRFLRGNPRISV
jgi:hypothetical protein